MTKDALDNWESLEPGCYVRAINTMGQPRTFWRPESTSVAEVRRAAGSPWDMTLEFRSKRPDMADFFTLRWSVVGSNTGILIEDKSHLKFPSQSGALKYAADRLNLNGFKYWVEPGGRCLKAELYDGS